MERPPVYQPVCREEEEDSLTQLDVEKDGTAWNTNSTEIVPTNTLSFVAFFSILLLSLAANILLVMDNAKLRTAQHPGKTTFGRLSQVSIVPSKG